MYFCSMNNRINLVFETLYENECQIVDVRI